jgi:hypothetical protein
MKLSELMPIKVWYNNNNNNNNNNNPDAFQFMSFNFIYTPTLFAGSVITGKGDISIYIQ